MEKDASIIINRYVPQLNCDGEIDWTMSYVKNKEIKRKMTVPYEKRKEYFRKYREAHREKFREYAKRFYIRRHKKGRSILKEVLGEKFNG